MISDPSISTVTVDPMSAPDPTTGTSAMTASRKRASSAWIAPLQEGLLLPRRGVVGVLLEVAELLGRSDPGDHLGTPDLGELASARRACVPRRSRSAARPARRSSTRRAQLSTKPRSPSLRPSRLHSWTVPSARAVRHALPRHRHRAARRRGSAAVGSWTSGSSEPARPEARRSPVGRRRFANGSTHRRIVERSDLVGRHARREGVEQRVLVLLRGIGRGPPDPHRDGCPERVQPVSTRGGPAVTEHRVLERRDAPPIDVVAAMYSTTWDGNQNWPSLVATARELGSDAVQGQRGHALDPLADAGQLDRCPRQRLAQLDHEDARRAGRNRSAPDDGAIGQQPDLAQQLGGVHERERGAGHPGMVPVRAPRYGARCMAASRARRAGVRHALLIVPIAVAAAVGTVTLGPILATQRAPDLIGVLAPAPTASPTPIQTTAPVPARAPPRRHPRHPPRQPRHRRRRRARPRSRARCRQQPPPRSLPAPPRPRHRRRLAQPGTRSRRAADGRAADIDHATTTGAGHSPGAAGASRSPARAVRDPGHLSRDRPARRIDVARRQRHGRRRGRKAGDPFDLLRDRQRQQDLHGRADPGSGRGRPDRSQRPGPAVPAGPQEDLRQGEGPPPPRSHERAARLLLPRVHRQAAAVPPGPPSGMRRRR